MPRPMTLVSQQVGVEVGASEEVVLISCRNVRLVNCDQVMLDACSHVTGLDAEPPGPSISPVPGGMP